MGTSADANRPTYSLRTCYTQPPGLVPRNAVLARNDSGLMHNRRVTHRDERSVATTRLHAEFIDGSVMAQTQIIDHIVAEHLLGNVAVKMERLDANVGSSQ